MTRMLLLFVALVFAVDFSTGATVLSSSTCRNSYDCGGGMCCRDSSGTVVSTQFGGFGPVMHPSSMSGTCTKTKAKSGEVCDTNCDCEQGYTCYRPVSGVCCPPMTCHNSTWVQHQRDYWAKCMADPHCGLPP